MTQIIYSSVATLSHWTTSTPRYHFMYVNYTLKHVTLSMTDAELVAVVTMVQDMMYIYRVIKSLDLQVELPMTAEMDNSGARDLANSWSVGGRTRHVYVCMFFLQELKEEE